MDVKEYQSGYYCKQNFLKFIIADIGLSMPDQIFTNVDVENQTGFIARKSVMPFGTIRRSVSLTSGDS